MTRLRMGRVVIIGAAALALVAAGTAAGAAIASGPVSGGVVNACYKTTAASNGSHAVLLENTGTKCPSGYTDVTWNQKGQTGPPGAAAGFEAQVTVNVLLNASSETTVASLNLPAGKFIVSAASLAGFSGTAPAVDGVQCDILSPAGGNAVAATQVNLNQDPGDAVGLADVALTTAFTTGGGTMIFECMDSTDQASMSNTTLTAVQVNTLSVQASAGSGIGQHLRPIPRRLAKRRASA